MYKYVSNTRQLECVDNSYICGYIDDFIVAIVLIIFNYFSLHVSYSRHLFA